MKITFIGAAGTVTGSKTLIESRGTLILVDCGQYQGVKSIQELNWEELPVLPATIDFVLLTHGHLDHCGWLPRLVSQGFKGKIFCTNPTRDIAKLILLDSAKIQDSASQYGGREPLYSVKQAQHVFPLFREAKRNAPIALDAEIQATFFNAGHILGACSIELVIENKRLVFSGDLGRDSDWLLYPPKKPTQADYVFLESTYGDRLHPATDTKLELAQAIENAFRKKGTVIIPSFAVERAQTIMYLVWQLKNENAIPSMPYVVDTPMGISALEIFTFYKTWHKLPLRICDALPKMFQMITDFHESLEVIEDTQPKVIIAASGMASGGRVLNYLEKYIEKSETSILFVGYQAEGTLGRRLIEGEKEVKIFGFDYQVNAKIIEITGLSAHADQRELLNWFSELSFPPKKVFLLHGEDRSREVLQHQISKKLNYQCVIPNKGESIEL